MMQPRRPIVEITTHPNICVIQGLPTEAARELFGCRDSCFSPDGNGHLFRISRFDLSVGECPYFGEIRIPRCRLDEAVRKLELIGYTVAITHAPVQIRMDRRPQPVFGETDPSWVRECQSVLLQEMVGRIVVLDSRGRLVVLEVLAKLHPLSNLVVVSPTRRGVEQLTTHFASFDTRKVTTSADDPDGTTPHILIATERQFADLPPDFVDVVVFADTHSCLGRQMLLDVMALNRHYIYAIQDSGRAVSEYQNWAAEYLAGEVIFRLPSPTGARRPIHSQTIGKRLGCATSIKGLETKRAAIWQNQARNQQIAGVAQGLVQRTWHPAMALPDFIAQMLAALPKVAILIESPEHGRAVQQLLPDWQLLRHGDVIGFGNLNQTIMTRLWAENQKRLDLDVLIRADGDRAPLRLRGFPATTHEIVRPVLLVELNC